MGRAITKRKHAKAPEPEVLTPDCALVQQAAEPRHLNQYTAPPKDLKAFRASVKGGTSLYKSMLSAGFTVAAAKQGFRRLPASFRKVVLAEKKSQIELAREFSPGEIGEYVAGGLLKNTMDGEDKSIRSYELLGKMKHVGLFTPDSQVGVFVLEMPAHLGRRIVAALPEHTDDAK